MKRDLEIIRLAMRETCVRFLREKFLSSPWQMYRVKFNNLLKEMMRPHFEKSQLLPRCELKEHIMISPREYEIADCESRARLPREVYNCVFCQRTGDFMRVHAN
jgi:hypothetical protein